VGMGSTFKKFLITGMLLVSVVVTPGKSSADTNKGPCTGPDAVVAVITCVANHFNVDIWTSRSVAYCESRYYRWAVNGQYKSIYQIGEDEWQDWKRPNYYNSWFPNPGRFHVRANVITAIWHVDRVGWSAWVACL
jgi:hypothetical protein